MTSYLTIARDGSAEVEVKRSRFLCTLSRVGSEDAARAVVERMRKQHWDARHHCSAFVLGPPGDHVERSSDDGEPAGTAGAPMLDVLRGAGGGAGVSDVVAVVTRWFGGTLLGAGGLVRAYSDAVRAGLDEVRLLRRSLLTELALEVGHADAGRVESELRARGVTVLGSSYSSVVTLRLGAPPADVEAVGSLVAELTSGTSSLEIVGERWVDGPLASAP